MGRLASVAACCQIVALIGVPLLAYFGYLCSTNSRLMELPDENKPDAATGCFIAAAMYAATFVCCKVYLSTQPKGPTYNTPPPGYSQLG